MPAEPFIRKEDLGRTLREIEEQALHDDRRPRLARRPSRGAKRWWFIQQQARASIQALAHLQNQLRGLPDKRARGAAKDFIRLISRTASPKHFPFRRDCGTDRETALWYLVLFHGGDPLPLLRDRSPVINGYALVAARYGLLTAHVMCSPHFANPPKRGPNLVRLKPYFTCDLTGQRLKGTPRTVWLCKECLHRLGELLPHLFAPETISRLLQR